MKYIQIPRQFPSQDEVEKVENQGKTSLESSKSSLVANLVTNVLLQGSLNKIWNMINGLQLIEHMKFFKIKSPGNVNLYTGFFAQISNFDIIETDEITDLLGYVPEMDAISLNF